MPIHIITGAPGSGKSHYLRYLIHRAQPPRLVLFDPLREYADQPAKTFQELRRAVSWDKFNVVYSPDSTGEETQEQFFALCETLNDTWIAVDEAHLIVPNNRNKLAPSAETFFRFHRHRAQYIALVSQLPRDMWTGLRSMAHTVSAFHAQEDLDARYLAGWFDPDRLRALPPYRFLEWSISTGYTVDEKQVPKTF